MTKSVSVLPKAASKLRPSRTISLRSIVESLGTVRRFGALVIFVAAGPHVACSSDGGGGGGSTGPTLTCDLRPENWYSACSKGCGDVMVCQSFCSGCTAKCMVPCVTSSDCELVGAGSCEISAKASNRCSKGPTKCP